MEKRKPFEVEISPDFTIEDIHKIREANYERTKNMTTSELVDYMNHCGEEGIQAIEALRKKSKTA